MYHIGDYLRFLSHRGPKEIVWCGSDILQLSKFWARILRGYTHYCENEVEQSKLEQLGIKAKIRYHFSEPVNTYPNLFRPSRFPKVWLNIHTQREEEYGLGIIKKIKEKVPEVTFHVYGIKRQNEQQVIYHGKIPNQQFNREIASCQAGLRLNKFDGISEVITKSVLYGQYPISAIKYPYIDHFHNEEELITLLNSLKHRTVVNPARLWWRKELSKNYKNGEDR